MSEVSAMGAGLWALPKGREEPPDPKARHAARGVANHSVIEQQSAEVILPKRPRRGGGLGKDRTSAKEESCLTQP
jgi:hypothetical protein